MGSSYGEAVLDFDLNFLHPTSNNTTTQSKVDKLRKGILIVKKKIISTDLLIKKYCTKKYELEITEKNFLASKEECKQLCLDNRKSFDSCSVLENDKLILQNTNKELTEKCFQVENQLEASKSHIHQLQILVKEYETLTESLKVEKKLATSNATDSAKKLLSVQKENKTLIRHITLAKDVIFGKKKLRRCHKELLQRYDKYKTENSVDAIFGTESSEEDDFEDSPLSPFYEDENTIKQVLKSPDTTTGIKPTNTTHIEYSNDLGSVDTGRGSSLAHSDSDKYSQSTDYFINDSPLSDISIANTHTKKLVDTATSPVPSYNTVNTATSPIEFETNRSDSIIIQNVDNCNHDLPDVFSSRESASVLMIDNSTSPIALCNSVEMAVSPITNLHTDIATSPMQYNFDDQNNIYQYEETQQLKECLELNSSNNICDENDGEIQVILSRMRMNHELVSPIPLTPVRSQFTNKMEVSLVRKQIEHEPRFNCPGAALARKETKELECVISKLAKDVNTIKSFLNIQSPSVHQNEDNGILNDDSLTEDNEFNISHPIVVRTPIVDHSNDYNSYTIINEEISITNGANELEVIDSNSPLQISENIMHLSLPPDIVIENDPNEFNGLVESADSGSKTIEYLQNKEEIITPNNFEFKTPVVRCEKLDLSRLSNKVNNTEIEYQHQRPSRKISKVKKLTRLGKLKRGILPKYKITEDCSRSSKRLHQKQRKIVQPTKKNKITDQDSSVTLNDKSVYEKAIKVMAALKSKQKSETSQSIHATSRNKKKENIDEYNKENTVTKIEKSKSVHQKDDQYTDKVELDNESSPLMKKSITTRSHRKYNNTQKNIHSVKDKDIDQDNICLSELLKRKDKKSPNEPILPEIRKRLRSSEDSLKDIDQKNICFSEVSKRKDEKSSNEPILQETRKRLRSSEDSLEVPSKRLLRSSVNHNPENVTDKERAKKDTYLNVEINNTELHSTRTKNKFKPIEVNKDNMLKRCKIARKSSVTQEIDNINNATISKEGEKHDSNSIEDTNPKQSILCVMIEKYGVQSVKYCVKKFSESIIDSIAKRIEEEIVNIIELPYNETKEAMNKLVGVILKWNIKQFIAGLIKYLQDPGRKLELYKTLELPPAPPMTKPEQVLLYIVAQLNKSRPTINIVEKILSSIEYTLFSLNRTPHFEVIESMSHFYAVICRYFKLKSRLRLFMLDAMYCIQYKSITLIKQCLAVWMHILPLAHMGIAKNPLVTCLVYLLHFYKCEDKFNKVRDMRIMLNRNYFYKFTDWNETHILEMFRSSIKDIKNTNKGKLVTKKMLRIALIILAKRQGTRWCQNNIIKKLLQPIIENDKTQDCVKEFCVSLLGPLMKPYPIDMKVHCEVVMNQLFNMLQNNPSPNMTEAIMASLIYMNRHNHHRVIEAMISWKPLEVSYEFEDIMRSFVRSKPLKAWKTSLAKIPL